MVKQSRRKLNNCVGGSIRSNVVSQWKILTRKMRHGEQLDNLSLLHQEVVTWPLRW